MKHSFVIGLSLALSACGGYTGYSPAWTGADPPGSTAAFDSFNEIATVRIELRDTDPVIWRQVEVPTAITLNVLHRIIRGGMVRLPPLGVQDR
jgi:Plasmid pRiA4b ORF-3-like protein